MLAKFQHFINVEDRTKRIDYSDRNVLVDIYLRIGIRAAHSALNGGSHCAGDASRLALKDDLNRRFSRDVIPQAAGNRLPIF